jgi:hypothetical protein
MKRFLQVLKDFWVYRSALILVKWDDTNYPYTYRGPRREGEFYITGLFQAWWWGLKWCFVWPKAAVRLYLTEGEKHANT